jgi:DNA-binding LytR/AlgR family response regulator
MLVGFLSAGLIIPWVFNRWLPNRHTAIQLLVVVIIISFPVTLVLAAFDNEHGSDWSAYVWLLQYRYVIVISAILMFGGYAVLSALGFFDVNSDKQQTTEENKAPHVLSPESKILKRLPNRYHQAELYAIASEDHYLRIFTDQGEELILMRLSDALLELELAKGMQTHRSWWVAHAAIADMRRTQGKLTLLLKSGLIVPVSRSFDKAVRDTCQA